MIEHKDDFKIAQNEHRKFAGIEARKSVDYGIKLTCGWDTFLYPGARISRNSNFLEDFSELVLLVERAEDSKSEEAVGGCPVTNAENKLPEGVS